MRKIRYEIDPHNRLIAEESKRKTQVKRFRKVYDGKFKIGKNNSLTYHVKTPVQDRKNSPRQIKFKGRWSLNKNHDLVFTFDKSKRQAPIDKLVIKGNIIAVNKNSLLFAVTTKTQKNGLSVYILKLAGHWQADKLNRLIFKLNKESSRYDILTFEGAWEANKKHQLVYRYEKARLIRKSKKVHTLIFKGHWDIRKRGRISYVLEKNTNSVFDFKVSAGVFEGRYIKYKISIGLRQKAKPAEQTVVFFGSWKISKNKGLTFEIKSKEKRINSIAFGAEVKLKDKNTLSFKLKNNVDNQDLGIDLKLSRRMLKGEGETFVRFLREKGECCAVIGAGRRW